MIQSMTSLPDNSKSFDLDVAEGDVTKQRFKGKFHCKCVLNLGERSAADVLNKKMNESLDTLNDETYMTHMMIAQLDVRLTKAPEWWVATSGGRELLDLNVVLEVYKQAMEAEREWRIEVWGEPEDEKKLEVAEDEDEEEEKAEETDE